MMRYFTYLTAFLFAALLASCGGGGGSPGISNGPDAAFVVAAPPTLTLQVGLSQQYSISGGVKPYSVFSNDPAVAVGWLAGENVFGVGTTATGKAIVTIRDAKGSRFDMEVTVGSSTAFFTTAPPALTLAPGPLAAQVFKLGGGTKPYKAVSSVPSQLSVVVNDTDVTFKALQVPGLATVTLTDSSSPPAVLTSTVTLGTIPLAVNPNTSTIATGSVLRAVITGGTPPYRALVTLDNCLIDAKIVQGNIVQAKGNKACTGSVLTVVDANNISVSLNVTIEVGSSALQLIPSALTIPENPNTPSLSLLLYGANSGPIQVFSTNTAVLAPQTPTNNGDGTYTVVLTGGDTCYFAGADYTIPRNGTFTDKVASPVDITKQPFNDRFPEPLSVPITITVLDSTGRQGISVITVRDNGLVDALGVSGKGCTGDEMPGKTP